MSATSSPSSTPATAPNSSSPPTRPASSPLAARPRAPTSPEPRDLLAPAGERLSPPRRRRRPPTRRGGGFQPMSRNQLDTTLYAVVSATFAVTSALSWMRSSELVELSAGCTRREERHGGATRFRLVTRRIKGEAFGGTEDAWVVIEDVYRAIRAAGALTGAAEGARLFATASNSSAVRFRVLRAWIRGAGGQHLGLEPVRDGPVNPRALRRTLALAIAQRPHGLMAAKVHLKHVSVATTEGYTARPGGHQAAFTAQVAAEEEAEH